MLAARGVPSVRMRSGSRAWRAAQLDHDEAGQQDGRHDQQRDGLGGAPADLRGSGQGVDERHEPRRDGHRARNVEAAALTAVTVGGQQHRAQSDQHGADRHVDVEDPLPAEGARQHAAQQGAGGRAAAGDAAPDAQGEIALTAFGEGRDEDRQGRRREQRAAQPLDAAKGDQGDLRPGEAAGQRSPGEDDEAGHEHAAPAEHVGQPAAEQQEAAEEDGVGRQHPLQALDGEVQVGADRRQRHVDHGDVEHDHELRHADGREDVPLATVP